MNKLNKFEFQKLPYSYDAQESFIENIVWVWLCIDENGNMKFDGGLDISLTYNPTINLPNEVDFGSNNRIFYYYTAGGAKLLKHVAPSSGSDTYTTYVGNFVYEDGKLAYILTSEGRLIPTGTGTDRKFLYEYTLKDHLGNSRVTFMGTDLGNALDVVQTNSYYPFGLTLLQNNGNTSDTYKKNKYLYNGKEIQDDNLNSKFFGMLDYGARFYDPQIGRWHSVDPLAEWHFNATPYHYCFNNPISFIDPFGMDTVYIPPQPLPEVDIYPKYNYSSLQAYWEAGQEFLGKMDEMVQGHTYYYSYSDFRATAEHGENNENAKAKGKTIDENIDGLLWMIKAATAWEHLSESLKFAEALHKGSEAYEERKELVEGTSDEKISKENTGSTEKLKTSGQPIKSADPYGNYQTIDPDTMKVPEGGGQVGGNDSVVIQEYIYEGKRDTFKYINR